MRHPSRSSMFVPAPEKGSLSLFRFRGITVFVHWSWLLVAPWQIDRRRDSYDQIGLGPDWWTGAEDLCFCNHPKFFFRSAHPFPDGQLLAGFPIGPIPPGGGKSRRRRPFPSPAGIDFPNQCSSSPPVCAGTVSGLGTGMPGAPVPTGTATRPRNQVSKPSAIPLTNFFR